MGGGRMSTKPVTETITDWFKVALVASLELPSGWFGRPYDNMHRLTWLVARDDKVIVELDGQLHLIVSDAEITANTDEVLELVGSQIVFDWREYGSSRSRHVEVEEAGGRVRFHAHVG